MKFFPENCRTDEERAEFIKKKQRELSDKANRELVGEEEIEEVSLLARTFRELGQGEKGGNIYFKQIEDESQLEPWEKHEQTLDKAKEPELIIEPNKYSFDNKELTLSDYLELETLYACGLNLKEVSFENLAKAKNFT